MRYSVVHSLFRPPRPLHNLSATAAFGTVQSIADDSDKFGNKNLSFFLCAKAECGTVVWDDDVDIAPEHLYECSKPVGGVFGG